MTGQVNQLPGSRAHVTVRLPVCYCYCKPVRTHFFYVLENEDDQEAQECVCSHAAA